jgi:hypothetical protein
MAIIISFCAKIVCHKLSLTWRGCCNDRLSRYRLSGTGDLHCRAFSDSCWPNFIFSLMVAALAEACSSDRVYIDRTGTVCRA